MRTHLSSLTKWSVAALLAGLSLGLAGHLTGLPFFTALGTVTQVVGDIWIAALQMITLPLALGLMLAAISGARIGTVGPLGARALVLFTLALTLFTAVALGLTSVFLSGFSVAPETAAALSEGVKLPAQVATGAPAPAGGWLISLIPTNVFEAAARGAMLPLLFFVVLMGLAVTRLPEAQRVPLAELFRAIADTLTVLVGWLIVVTPVGVFALSYGMALASGGSLAGILGVYLLTQPAVTLICVLLFYPLTALLGRVTMGAYGRAVLPAQIVAVTTRSSLMSLPAQVDGGRQHLGLSTTATSLLLPLSVSLFRISEVISNSVKLLFLAHVYGVALQPGTIVAFFATVFLFNFSGTGTPNSGGGIGFRMLPVFAAAGIPVEGVLILEAVETIPDIFATLVNVTGQMSATTILSRRAAVSQ